jgi:hypothetical protein
MICAAFFSRHRLRHENISAMTILLRLCDNLWQALRGKDQPVSGSAMLYQRTRDCGGRELHHDKTGDIRGLNAGERVTECPRNGYLRVREERTWTSGHYRNHWYIRCDYAVLRLLLGAGRRSPQLKRGYPLRTMVWWR